MTAGATAEIEHVYGAGKASTGALKRAAELLMGRARNVTLIVGAILRGGSIVGFGHPINDGHADKLGLGI